MTDFIWIDGNGETVLASRERDFHRLNMRLSASGAGKIRFQEAEGTDEAMELLEGA